MTIDDIQNVVDEFAKRLQLPESRYSFAINNNAEFVELIIFVDDMAKLSLSISNGSLRVIYTDEYDSDKYTVIKFLTPVSLAYYLCMFFYTTVSSISDMDFNDVLSVVFLNEIYDWRTLLQGIAENLGLQYRNFDKYVTINDIEIHYNGFINKIKIDTQEISLADSSYTTVVEAMFKCVEYVANIMDVADKLFNADNYSEEEEDNLLEESDEENFEGGGPSMDFDMDIDMNEDEENVMENPEPVEPMENEDFSEPQEPVVTVDDVM